MRDKHKVEDAIAGNCWLQLPFEFCEEYLCSQGASMKHICQTLFQKWF